MDVGLSTPVLNNVFDVMLRGLAIEDLIELSQHVRKDLVVGAAGKVALGLGALAKESEYVLLALLAKGRVVVAAVVSASFFEGISATTSTGLRVKPFADICATFLEGSCAKPFEGISAIIFEGSCIDAYFVSTTF